MKIKRAILTGALLWVLIFFEVSILMFGFKLAGINYYLVHYLLAAVLTTICAMIYFNKNKATAKTGFILGIIFLITGIILDVAITIPLFIKSYAFFANPLLWLGYAEGVLVVTLVGFIEKKL